MRLALDAFEDRRGKVEEVLRRFATSEPPCRDGTPFSFLIPDLSREIVRLAWGNLPSVPRKAARAKLEALKKAAAAMKADFLADRSLAVAFPLEERLSIALIAHSKVVLNGQCGSPRKHSEQSIARFLAGHFKGLTGDDPGRSTPVKDGYALPTGGRFIQLLSEIYRVLGIAASPDSQARAALEAMEKNTSTF